MSSPAKRAGRITRSSAATARQSDTGAQRVGQGIELHQIPMELRVSDRQWRKCGHRKCLMEMFGTSGMTAYFGMRECGPLMPRDCVAVAAATGSVGSIVAQLAKIAGCYVVGFGGGADRCDWVLETLGIDKCIDYTAGISGSSSRAHSHGASMSFLTASAALLRRWSRQS